MPPEANGNGNGEGKGNETGAGDVQAQLSELKSQFEGLQKEHETLKEAKSDLERKLDQADKELLSDDYLKFKESKGKLSHSVDKEIDLDTATSKEIAQYFSEKYKGDLDKAINGIVEKFSQQEERIGMAMAQIDIEMTAIKHPDFYEYKDRIKELGKENPTWGAEKLYKQAKLEAKAEAEEKAKLEREKEEKERKVWSEKGDGLPPGAVKDKQLTKEEAAEIAYRQAFGNKE